MITISHEPGYVHVIVAGEFTLQDYKEFEDNALYHFKFDGPTNMLFDLREMLNYTVDVAIEELRFLQKNKQNFGRVAVLSKDQIVSWGAWLNALLSDANIRHFDDIEDAETWVGETEEVL